MKITKMDKQQLTVCDRPWLFAGLMCAFGLFCIFTGLSGGADEGAALRALFFVIGLGVLYITHRYLCFQTIVIDKVRKKIHHTVYRITGPSQSVYPLNDISRVVAECDTEESGMRRLSLRSDKELIPLESGYTSAEREKLAETLSEWLRRNGVG